MAEEGKQLVKVGEDCFPVLKEKLQGICRVLEKSEEKEEDTDDRANC